MHVLIHRLARLAYRGCLGSVAAVIAAGPFSPGAGVTWREKEFRVNAHTAQNQQLPSVARSSNGSFVVAWEEGDGDTFGIYAQRYSALGAPQGSPFLVNTHTANRQSFPAVAMNASGSFVIAWDSDHQDAPGLSVRAQLFAPDGTPVGSELRVNGDAPPIISVHFLVAVGMDDSGRFIIAWPNQNRSTVFVRWYAADGSREGDSFVVYEGRRGEVRSLVAAVNGKGDAVMAWTKKGSGSVLDSISLRYMQSEDRSWRPIVKANADADVAVDRPAVSIGPLGDFVVAWETADSDGAPAGVRARRYAASGEPLTDEFAAGSPSEMAREPGVAMDADGSFAIVAQGDAIYAREFAADGTATADAFRVNSQGQQPYMQIMPALATDSSGDFVAVWQVFGQDGDGRDIYAELFRAGPTLTTMNSPGDR